MKLSFVAVSMFFAITADANAVSSKFETVGPVHKFEFDTNDGYYAAWDKEIICPVNALRATVHLTRYGKPTTTFEPGVNVYLTRGAEPNVEFGKLGFHATGFHPPFLTTMSAGGPKATSQKLTLAAQTGGTDWFSFELHWTYKGAVEATVDGQSGTVTMRGPPEHIHLMGFSGAGEVSIQLGYFRTKDQKDSCRPVA